jgi:hypothetical protein
MSNSTWTILKNVTTNYKKQQDEIEVGDIVKYQGVPYKVVYEDEKQTHILCKKSKSGRNYEDLFIYVTKDEVDVLPTIHLHTMGKYRGTKNKRIARKAAVAILREMRKNIKITFEDIIKTFEDEQKEEIKTYILKSLEQNTLYYLNRETTKLKRYELRALKLNTEITGDNVKAIVDDDEMLKQIIDPRNEKNIDNIQPGVMIDLFLKRSHDPIEFFKEINDDVNVKILQDGFFQKVNIKKIHENKIISKVNVSRSKHNHNLIDTLWENARNSKNNPENFMYLKEIEKAYENLKEEKVNDFYNNFLKDKLFKFILMNEENGFLRYYQFTAEKGGKQIKDYQQIKPIGKQEIKQSREFEIRNYNDSRKGISQINPKFLEDCYEYEYTVNAGNDPKERIMYEYLIGHKYNEKIKTKKSSIQILHEIGTIKKGFGGNKSKVPITGIPRYFRFKNSLRENDLNVLRRDYNENLTEGEKYDEVQIDLINYACDVGDENPFTEINDESDSD